MLRHGCSVPTVKQSRRPRKTFGKRRYAEKMLSRETVIVAVFTRAEIIEQAVALLDLRLVFESPDRIGRGLLIIALIEADTGQQCRYGIVIQAEGAQPRVDLPGKHGSQRKAIQHGVRRFEFRSGPFEIGDHLADERLGRERLGSRHSETDHIGQSDKTRIDGIRRMEQP